MYIMCIHEYINYLGYLQRAYVARRVPTVKNNSSPF